MLPFFSAGGACPLYDPVSKPSFPFVLLPILECLWILSLTVKPNFKYRRLLFFPIATIISWSFACTCLRSGRVGIDIGLATRLIIILFSAWIDILLTVPQRDLRKRPCHKKVDDSEDKVSHSVNVNNTHQNGGVLDETFFSRLKWGISYWFSPRGIGFANERTDVLPSKQSPSTTRKEFLLGQLYINIYFYILLDTSMILLHLHDARRRWDILHGLPGFLDPWRLLSLGMGLHVYSMMSIEYNLFSIPFVATGFSQLQAWPAAFHSPLEAYTLKRFWGKFWHQLFRRLFQVPSAFIAHDILGLPRSKSEFVLFVKISIAFFLSGILHFITVAFPRQSIRELGSFQFFCLQPVGMLFEGAVINVWRSFGRVSGGPTPVGVKMLGYTWVLLWLAYTSAAWSESMLEGGYLDDVSFGFPSIIMGLWKGQWTWPENNRWDWNEIVR